MRWFWPLDAWRILINPIRNWSTWFRRILDLLIFRNKPSFNKICILFELHQKRKLVGAWKGNCACRTALISWLILRPSPLIPSISRLIKLISRLLYLSPFCICLCICSSRLLVLLISQLVILLVGYKSTNFSWSAFFLLSK